MSSKLPAALSGGLTAQGIPALAAHQISHLPPIGVLFAAFLGYNRCSNCSARCSATCPLGMPPTSLA